MDAISKDIEPPRSIGVLDRLTAAFFGIPAQYVSRLEAQDWAAHRAVITFLLVVVIPLSAVSFGHLSTLILASGGDTALLSADQVYWASAVGGGLFGVLLTWLNDSGMTIMLRRPGQSWQKAIGLLSRGAFIVLNVVLFTAAITAFSLRDRIEQERMRGEERAIASGTQLSDRDVKHLSTAIRQRTAKITNMRASLLVLPPNVVELNNKTKGCRSEENTIADQLRSHRSELRSLNNRLNRAIAQQNVNLAGDLRRQRNEKRDEVSRFEETLTQKESECNGFFEEAEKAKVEYTSNLKASISADEKQLERDHNEVERLKTLADQARSRAEEQAKLGFGENLSAEYVALAALLKGDETAPRVIAIVVALFFGLIDLTPVIWGWSLRGGGVDAFLAQQSETYLRSLALAQESIIRAIEAEDAANAAYCVVRSAEEQTHRRRQAHFEANLAAAKQYANAVAALEKMLASEHQFGTSPEIIDRVRQEGVDALSTTFRTTSAPEVV